MVLAFLQGEIDSPTNRGDMTARGLAHIRANRSQLIDHADLTNPQQNYNRCWVLGYARGYRLNQYIFTDFPDDTAWRLVTVTPEEIGRFRYAKCDPWDPLSGGTRLVADGVRNLDQVQFRETHGNVSGIANRLRQGDRFPALIAIQCGADSVPPVLLEGHTRATAYALTDSPGEFDVIIGSSTQMNRWAFF
jgi:hypothetical protein